MPRERAVSAISFVGISDSLRLHAFLSAIYLDLSRELVDDMMRL
jgi:hypothetical protein